MDKAYHFIFNSKLNQVLFPDYKVSEFNKNFLCKEVKAYKIYSSAEDYVVIKTSKRNTKRVLKLLNIHRNTGKTFYEYFMKYIYNEARHISEADQLEENLTKTNLYITVDTGNYGNDIHVEDWSKVE
jgi:hypothetical protein